MASRVGSAVRNVVVTVVILALFAGAAFAFANRQAISDGVTAAQFTPSPEIEALDERIMLTRAGHRIFFASEPTLDSSQHFNEQCEQVTHAEGGHVLGCYVSGQIHLFLITDDRLSGIVEATAVHELLHATFARMSDRERQRVITLLESTFDDLSATQPDLVERMSVYDGLSEVGFANELHSVLGTEVATLPAELETHYAQWITDRALIVGYFEQSHEVFSELQTRADDLKNELEALRLDIETRSAAYDQAVQQFNADLQAFSERNKNFEFSDSPELFYATRDALDARRDALNAELAALQADIARYESLQAELQQLGEVNNELVARLNSDLAPPATAP